jgi:hypothetical protein
VTWVKAALAIIVFFRQMFHFGLLFHVQVATLRHIFLPTNTRKFLLFFQDAEGDEDDSDREDQGNAAVKVMCRLCLSGENEGSSKASKMLPCKLCHKKYHQKCLKSWGDHRGDLKFVFWLSFIHLLSSTSFDSFCSI